MDTEPQGISKQLEKTEEFLSWISPSRLFKKRDKEFFTNVGVIVFLLIVIVIFAKEYMLVLVVLSIVFFIYVTSTVPPEDVKHKLTNMGIESAGHFYRWEELYEFWFEERWGQISMFVRPNVGSYIIILLGNQDKNTVKEIVAKYIPFREEPQKSFVDNASRWISDKIPLEKPS
jgi:hypothetical protein